MFTFHHVFVRQRRWHTSSPGREMIRKCPTDSSSSFLSEASLPPVLSPGLPSSLCWTRISHQLSQLSEIILPLSRHLKQYWEHCHTKIVMSYQKGLSKNPPVLHSAVKHLQTLIMTIIQMILFCSPVLLSTFIIKVYLNLFPL